MRHNLSRLAIPAILAGILASCAPSPIPTGYKYHHEKYKSPPAPKAEEIGYAFTTEANQKAVDIWQDIGRDLVGKLENGYVFHGRDVAIIAPLGVDQMNKSLDYALHKAMMEKGYNLKAFGPDIPGISTTMHPLAGIEKSNMANELTAFAAKYGYKGEEVQGVSIHMQVREGAKLVHELRYIYVIPNFGFDPEFNRQHEYRLNPSVGRAPFRVEPELRPALVRPAAPVVPTPVVGEGSQGEISKDDLAPPESDNKPIDLQGFNN